MQTLIEMLKKDFDTFNYEIKRKTSMGKNKKIFGLMKDESGGKITKEFVTLRPTTYIYLEDDGCVVHKKVCH